MKIKKKILTNLVCVLAFFVIVNELIFIHVVFRPYLQTPEKGVDHAINLKKFKQLIEDMKQGDRSRNYPFNSPTVRLQTTSKQTSTISELTSTTSTSTRTSKPLQKTPEKLPARQCKHGEIHDMASNSSKPVPFAKIPGVELYVYTVYYDRRKYQINKTLTAFAVGTYENRPTNLKCRILFQNNKEITVAGVLVNVWVWMKTLFPAPNSDEYIHCPLPNSADAQGVVSVTFGAGDNYLSVPFPVHERGKVIPPNKIALCVKTMRNYGQKVEHADLIIEWFEHYKNIGIDKVFIYGTYDITDEITNILKYYVRQNFLEMLPWNFPDYICNIVNGQELLNNECVMRTVDDYRYLLNLDFDELLVLQEGTSLPQLMASLDTSDSLTDFSFKQIRYCHKDGYARPNQISVNLPDGIVKTLVTDPSADPKITDCKSALETCHMYMNSLFPMIIYDPEKNEFQPKTLSKPSQVYMYAVHSTHKFLHGGQMLVPEYLAEIHHYRRWDSCVEGKTIEAQNKFQNTDFIVNLANDMAEIKRVL